MSRTGRPRIDKKKVMISVRLDADLAAWGAGGGRTNLVASLLQAYRERRILVSATPAPLTEEQPPEPKGEPEMQIEIVQGGKVLRTHFHQDNLYAEAPKTGTYTVRLRNDGPSRREIVLSVDGVNVINGEEARVEARGYILGPWETVEVPGWKRDGGKAAAFRFAAENKSYAAQTGHDTRNVGIIGAAVFDEKVRPVQKIVIEKHIHHHDHELWPGRRWPWYDPYRPTWLLNDTVYGVVDSSVTYCSTNSKSLRANSEVVDVGTAYGEEVNFQTTSVGFERATIAPAVILELRYATRERLKKMGIDLSAPAPNTKAPSAFPGSSTGTSVPAPPGWRG